MLSILGILHTLLSGKLPDVEIWIGKASDATQSSSGLITIIQAPSPGIQFGTLTKLTSFQVDVWSSAILTAEMIKDKIIDAVSGYAAIYSGTPICFSVGADSGCTQDTDGEMWRYILIINAKYVR